MNKIFGAILASAMICIAFSFFAAPVHAQTDNVPPPAIDTPEATELPTLSSVSPPQATPAKKAAKHKSTSHHRKRGKKSKSKSKHRSGGSVSSHERVRTAQITLAQLGYNPGPADGIVGTRTRVAVKSFQRDHHLRADGILGPITYAALIRETGSQSPMRSSEAPPENFYATHPDFYGYYGGDYTNPNALGSPQTIPSRFGSLEIDDQQTGQTHQYVVMLNGQKVFEADNQPAPINVSRTFNLNNADAVVLTSYANGDGTCPYHHYLLVVRANSNGLHPIANCTKAYEVYTEDGNLMIHFPEALPNAWSSGAMWRYENGTLAQF